MDEELWAWQVHEHGRWSVIAVVSGDITLPLITSRRDVHEKLRKFAERHWIATGLPVRAARYTLVETVEEFEV